VLNNGEQAKIQSHTRRTFGWYISSLPVLQTTGANTHNTPARIPGTLSVFQVRPSVETRAEVSAGNVP
jgi:hypothetical protein